MAHYFRDRQISNISVDDSDLSKISAVFTERARTLNEGIPDNDETDRRAVFSYIIRFDEKGYRVFSLAELLRYFHEAKEVERIIFTVETGESLRSNRQIGTFLELRLDKKAPDTCFMSVTSDNKDWVDASYSAVQAALANCKNKNGWARTAWTQFAVQIIGVTLGFVLSLWAAAKLAPKLTIENSFVITFLFILLLFSNTWTYLNQRILLLIATFFPSMQFHRPGKDRTHWLMQALIGGIAAAIVLYLLSAAFTFLQEVLGSFVSKGA